MNDANLINEVGDLTRHDHELIGKLIDIRSHHKREMAKLTNKLIAEKFDVTEADIARIAKYRMRRRPCYDK